MAATAESTQARQASRVIVRDRAGLVLLFNGTDPAVPGVSYWFTPGGGLDPGETFEQAATRELLEETSLRLSSVPAPVRDDTVVFSFEGVTYEQVQRYFAVDVDVDGPALAMNTQGWTDYEVRSMKSWHWWSVAELEATPDKYYPEDLPALLATIASWGIATVAPVA